jgi:hypothetical protein
MLRASSPMTSGLVARVTGKNTTIPTPAAYNLKTMIGDAPKYTPKSRHPVPERPTGGPYRALLSLVGEGPKISLASPHKERGAESTPGPAYIPPALGLDAQKSAWASRHAQGPDSRLENPGPCAYNITPKFVNEANRYILHQRTRTRSDETPSPGPGVYAPNMDAVKRRVPSATVHIRPQNPQKEGAPGYVNCPSTSRHGGITIGLKEYLDLIPVSCFLLLNIQSLIT